MLIQTYEEESDTTVAKYESSNPYPGITHRCLYTINKRTLCMLDPLKNGINDFQPSLRLFESRT